MQSHSMLDLSKAKEKAILAINDYLEGKKISADRDGFFHGDLGKIRAKKMRYCLNISTTVENRFSIFLALFEKSSIFSFRKSKRLAALIANEWITGEYKTEPLVNSIASEVFHQTLLKKSINDVRNHIIVPTDEHHHYSYYDKTKGVSELLQTVFNMLDKTMQKKIIVLTKKLITEFNSPSLTMSTSFFAVEKAQWATIAALTGSFLYSSLGKEMPILVAKEKTQTKEPEAKRRVKEDKEDNHFKQKMLMLSFDNIIQVSQYLTREDTARLTRVNSSAAKAVNEWEEKTKISVTLR